VILFDDQDWFDVFDGLLLSDIVEHIPVCFHRKGEEDVHPASDELKDRLRGWLDDLKRTNIRAYNRTYTDGWNGVPLDVINWEAYSPTRPRRSQVTLDGLHDMLNSVHYNMMANDGSVRPFNDCTRNLVVVIRVVAVVLIRMLRREIEELKHQAPTR